MRANRPSLTAQRVAMSRAAHQLFDHPRVLEDPLAAPPEDMFRMTKNAPDWPEKPNAYRPIAR